MKKLLILFLLFVCKQSYGQIADPVKWSYAIKKINDKLANVYIKATIEDGWHTYSQFVKPGGPHPTVITFDRSKDFVLIGKTTEPAPIMKYEEVFSMNVGHFDKSVTFQQQIKINKLSGFVIKGKVAYMACTDKQCMAPQDVAFTIPLK